jgi:hypothetical protein
MAENVMGWPAVGVEGEKVKAGMLGTQGLAQLSCGQCFQSSFPSQTPLLLHSESQLSLGQSAAVSPESQTPSLLHQWARQSRGH